MATIKNESFQGLLDELLIEGYEPSIAFNDLLETDAKYLKELKINVGNALFNPQNLDKKEAALLAYGTVVNERIPFLVKAFRSYAIKQGADEKELAETSACVSLLTTNNVYYRFKHFAKKEYYNTQPAGIKMGIMLNPVLGKGFFELLSLVVSALNGCEMCVTSHEQSVLQLGISEGKVLESVKLGAVIKGFVTALA